MKTLPSAEFRKIYASLKEPVVVTVKGHPIGYWTPGEMAAQLVTVAPGAPRDKTFDGILSPGNAIGRMSQAQRDAILRTKK